MWDTFQNRRIFDLYQFSDMINSPFAFPRMPPRARAPLGISYAAAIKEKIVKDKDTMMERLSFHQTRYQRYASGLFDLSSGMLNPQNPIHMKMRSIELLQEENEKLRKENSIFKSEHDKQKKKSNPN